MPTTVINGEKIDIDFEAGDHAACSQIELVPSRATVSQILDWLRQYSDTGTAADTTAQEFWEECDRMCAKEEDHKITWPPRLNGEPYKGVASAAMLGG